MKTDEEVRTEWVEAARSLSYYNAAEGSAWFSEVKDRAAAQKMFNEIDTELSTRHLPRPEGNFLC